jgi:peptide/nickel transport system substrate-binding protein
MISPGPPLNPILAGISPLRPISPATASTIRTRISTRNYTCGAEGNYIKYCNPELDQMVDRQSMEADMEKRKALVWQIERKLAEDGVRLVIMYFIACNCRQPDVKGLTLMSNSIYNGWRMEDVWLDK